MFLFWANHKYCPLSPCLFAKGTKKLFCRNFVGILKASGDYYAIILKNLNKVKILFVYFKRVPLASSHAQSSKLTLTRGLLSLSSVEEMLGWSYLTTYEHDSWSSTTIFHKDTNKALILFSGVIDDKMYPTNVDQFDEVYP